MKELHDVYEYDVFRVLRATTATSGTWTTTGTITTAGSWSPTDTRTPVSCGSASIDFTITTYSKPEIYKPKKFLRKTSL